MNVGWKLSRDLQEKLPRTCKKLPRILQAKMPQFCWENIISYVKNIKLFLNLSLVQNG
jgi:hypothetical protein